MKILRTSCFTDPHQPPTIAVTPEDAITGTIEELIQSSKLPGMFVTHQVFEMEGNPAPPEFTFEAARQLSDEIKLREQNQAVLYFYVAFQLGPVRRGGLICGDRPAPLTREEMLSVFEQLRRHPNYADHHFVYPDADGEVVTYPEASR